MYGIKGIDHLAKKGLLATVLAGSYPSGPSSMESPAIWKMIAANEVAAYNLPSGVMFDMLRDAAARRAGVLTRVGLDTFVDPRRQGAKMNAAAREDVVRVVEFGGEEWLHFRNVHARMSRSCAARAPIRTATSRWSTKGHRSARSRSRSRRATAAAW